DCPAHVITALSTIKRVGHLKVVARHQRSREIDPHKVSILRYWTPDDHIRSRGTPEVTNVSIHVRERSARKRLLYHLIELALDDDYSGSVDSIVQVGLQCRGNQLHHRHDADQEHHRRDQQLN